MAYLNKEQLKASKPGGGVELVIAGAGAGKTKTLVEKVKNIILSSTFEPGNILILTFSRKAALEIKDRVKSETGDCAEKITSGTFHSFCLNLLKDNNVLFLKRFNYKKFPSILEESERDMIIMKMIVPNLHKFLGLPARILYSLMLSTQSLQEVMIDKLEDAGINNELNILRKKFKELKFKNNLIEFEDMMKYTIDLLRENDDLRMKIHNRFRYILVDEFQDTSDNNLELLQLLLPEKNKNLFAVGDDYQAIYAFRYSRVEYIVNIKRYFPGVKVYKLQTNYRSRSEIVKLSNAFIKRNKIKTNKKLKSFRGQGGLINYYYVNDENEEHEQVCKLLNSSKNNNRDMAILYRNNYQGDHLRRYVLQKFTEKELVNFMTIHSAKGLEFKEVIIIGVSDRIIPNRSSDIEEERRLFYVALTRACDMLHIIIHLNEDGSLPLFAKELGLAE